MTYLPLRTIQNRVIRTSSFQCMTQSWKHLIAGTSTATIFIFTKTNECKRPASDIHACSTPGADKLGCLQKILKLPPYNKTDSGNLPCVTSVLCTGPYYVLSHLYAGDSTGQLCVWEVPFDGIDYRPIVNLKAHKGAINALGTTFKHLLSCGDDGILLFVDLESCNIVRRMDLLGEAVKRGLAPRPDVIRRLKSIFIREDADEGGTVAVGTSYGDIFLVSIGTNV